VKEFLYDTSEKELRVRRIELKEEKGTNCHEVEIQ